MLGSLRRSAEFCGRVASLHCCVCIVWTQQNSPSAQHQRRHLLYNAFAGGACSAGRQLFCSTSPSFASSSCCCCCSLLSSSSCLLRPQWFVSLPDITTLPHTVVSSSSNSYTIYVIIFDLLLLLLLFFKFKERKKLKN